MGEDKSVETALDLSGPITQGNQRKDGFWTNIDGVALSGNEDFQKAVCKTLEKTNIKDKNIQILFNRNFTSGMGWSNQDLYGATNVWKDGPVFTLSEVRRFPGIFI